MVVLGAIDTILADCDSQSSGSARAKVGQIEGLPDPMHDEFESPIEVEVNMARLLMDRIHGVLEFQLRNRSDGESFEIEVRVRGRGVAEGQRQRPVRLAGGERLAHLVPVHLHAGESGGSSAGDAMFEVEIDVSAPGERHRFAGRFLRRVLAYAETLQQVTVNIGKVIEQNDKGGMGSINEVELRDLVNLPETTDVNTWLNQDRVPAWTAVLLEYRGPVEGEAMTRLHRRAGARRRMTSLRHADRPGSLLITSETVVRVGRRRELVDLVTWVLPANEEANHRTRHISSEHAHLKLSERGPSILAVSSSSPTTLDGRPVRGAMDIPTGRPSTLCLGGQFHFRVRPLEAPHFERRAWTAWIESPDNHHADMWRWSETHGLGGLLLERTDGWAHRERYLWLFSAVKIADLGLVGGRSRSRLLLAAMPHLVMVHLGDAPPVKVGDRMIGSFEAAPLAAGDRCECEEWSLEVGEFEQQFE